MSVSSILREHGQYVCPCGYLADIDTGVCRKCRRTRLVAVLDALEEMLEVLRGELNSAAFATHRRLEEEATSALEASETFRFDLQEQAVRSLKKGEPG